MPPTPTVDPAAALHLEDPPRQERPRSTTPDPCDPDWIRLAKSVTTTHPQLPALGSDPEAAARWRLDDDPAPRPGPSPRTVPTKGRHALSGGLSLGVLCAGGLAWAIDPQALSGLPSEALYLGPGVVLGVQALKSLVDYLRDYGAERLRAQVERAERAEARAARLEAEVARLEREKDDARDRELAELRKRLEGR